MLDQKPFGLDAGLAENPEPRCPCVLLLDTSYSMNGEAMTELNNGLQGFRDELAADRLAAKRAELALVTFGGEVRMVCDFTSPETFAPPALEPNGNTPMGEAILRAIAMVRDRKDQYRANGISYYRPWIFLFTDGAPTDDWQAAAAQVREGEAKKAFAFFCVGVEGADFAVLKQIATREALKLKGVRFRDMFVWLSSSMRSVSSSQPGDEVKLDNPTGPAGWASVAT